VQRMCKRISAAAAADCLAAAATAATHCGVCSHQQLQHQHQQHINDSCSRSSCVLKSGLAYDSCSTAACQSHASALLHVHLRKLHISVASHGPHSCLGCLLTTACCHC
jgi:hypothetical protein